MCYGMLGGHASRTDDACPFLFSPVEYPSGRPVSLSVVIQFCDDNIDVPNVRSTANWQTVLIEILLANNLRNSLLKTSKASLSNLINFPSVGRWYRRLRFAMESKVSNSVSIIKGSERSRLLCQ